MGIRRRLESWLPLRRRQAREADLERELRDHLDMEAEEQREAGLSAKEAECAARRALGNTLKIKEDVRTAWGFQRFETLIQDLRYGLRQLRRNAGFTAVAVITLALGIGANTAIFSVVDAVFLHAAPYVKSDQLVEISEKSPSGEPDGVSAGDLAEWKAQNQAFQGMAAYRQWEFHSLSGVGQPDEVWASPVSNNIFDLLGVNAAVGRTFGPDERQAIVLSHEYWRSHFSADPAVIGKLLALDGKAYVVVGVAPGDFEFPRANTQMWVALPPAFADQNNHEERTYSVIGRLKPGVTLSEAQAEMDLISHRLGAAYPKTEAGWSTLVKPFRGQEVDKIFRKAVLALTAAVVFVLLIVCANVASMLLARGAARQEEIAIRAALGAGRFRLIRQLLVESVTLAGVSSIGGLAIAATGLHLMASLMPKYRLLDSHGLHNIGINVPALVFMVAVSALTGVTVGILPALRLLKVDLNQTLKEGGRGGLGATGRSRFQDALVVTEIALAFILLVGAGLMIETFRHLQAAPTGFKPDHVLTVRVPLMSYKYSSGAESSTFYRSVLERIEAIPGVVAAGMANNLPFTGFNTANQIPAPGNSPDTHGTKIIVRVRGVSPGYFRAMGIPLVEGREFTPADSEHGAACVRIINKAMADRYWPGDDPIGKQMFGVCPKGAAALIVGVVADSKQASVASPADPEMYEPYAQHPFASFLVTFVIRTSSDPLRLSATVRNAVWEIDHDQPVIQVRTMENVISESLWQQDFLATILAVFAAIALLLSAVGIYGVLSYSSNMRIHEMGIRMAMGAERWDVLKLMVGRGFMLALAGTIIGIGGSLILTRFLSSLLYGIKANDPVTFLAVASSLLVVALTAVYIPSHRVTKIDPMSTLRYE